MKITPLLKSHYLIAAMFSVGIFYLFVLQCLIPEGAFFSGDSGLKAMLSQNLAKGNLGFNLDFPVQPWIKTLWDDGLFPYQEPFVYKISEKYFITFPFTFSLITSFFYNALGYRGFYIIPLISTFVIWFSFYKVCKKLELSHASIILGLINLIFACNLPIYSAIFSEQTISVCLAFASFSLIIPPKGSKKLTFWAAFWAGILSGLAVWFRPEQIFLVIFIDSLSVWAFLTLRLKSLSTKFVFVKRYTDYIGNYGSILLLTSTLSLLLYGLSNILIYKNFLGVHAIQVVEHHSLIERLAAALSNFQTMTVGYYSFFVYVPIALFPLVYIFGTWAVPTQYKLDSDWFIYYLLFLVYIFGVSLLVPAGAGGKQWGPRFLLFLVPIVILLFTKQFDHLAKNQSNLNKFFRKSGLILIMILVVVGIAQNLLNGIYFLSNTYAQIKPALKALHSISDPVIAISDQFIGQVLQPAGNPNFVFFLVNDEDQLGRLTETLVQTNQDSFTYICFTFDCKLFNKDSIIRQIKRNGIKYIVQVNTSGEFGKYNIFDIFVRRKN